MTNPVANIIDLRTKLVEATVSEDYSFNVVFAAYCQVISAFLFDFLLLEQGEMDEESVTDAVERFSEQLLSIALIGLKNQQPAAEPESKIIISHS